MKQQVGSCRWAIVLLGILLGWSCSEDPGPPSDVIYWYVEFSNTTGNGLEGGGGTGSSRSSWKAFLEVVPKYDVRAVSRFWSDPPTQDLDVREAVTLWAFIEQFQSAFDAGGAWSLNSTTLLFGVDTIRGLEPGAQGFTWPKGTERGNARANAVSFVFRGAITRIPGLSAQQAWAVTSYVVLHELGHARGLMGNGGEEFDHNYHQGAGSNECVMKNFTAPLAYQPTLCEWHRRVLAQCLREVQGAYSSNAIDSDVINVLYSR
jgi:hypothetical protein